MVVEPGMGEGLLIIWHSRTGAARAMADAAGEGGSSAAPCTLLPAEDVTPADLVAAGGYLFCCPENLGSMTGMMKEFFDRCYYPVLGLIEGRPYATMIAAGSDGTGAERQIDRIVTGWRLRRVAEPLIICTKAQTPNEILGAKRLSPDQLQRCHDLGQAFSTALNLGVF